MEDGQRKDEMKKQPRFSTEYEGAYVWFLVCSLVVILVGIGGGWN